MANSTITTAAAFRAAVGENVRVHRESARFTQVTLAERAKVSAGLVSRLERGRANPRLLTMEKIAGALDTSLAELLDIEGSEIGLGYRQFE